MLTGSIVALFLAVILFVGFLLPSLAMAQLQQQQTTTTTTTTMTTPSSSLSITTIPPLTPEEQEQQIRLQSTIAATTRDLNETEKQVSGIVYTPRWSEPVWINSNSIAVLIAYCLPGEFAESGQEILGGFGLEVLESYAVALPQGFMAWMAVVGNEGDVQNRRFPAAVGVICASDLNNAETRVLSPQEQQQINNINQQFTTIQNTQITNIDQVINIINNVTEPATEEQSLTVEAIANVTEAYLPVWVMFDAMVTGGTPPYNYSWGGFASEIHEKSFTQLFDQPDPFIFVVSVTDSKGQTASDDVQIVINRPPTNDTGGGTTTEDQPFRTEIITNATEIGRTPQFLQVQGYTGSMIKFDAKMTGGTPPYYYYWMTSPGQEMIDTNKSLILGFFEPGTFYYTLVADDSSGKRWSDRVQVIIEERPGVLPPPETGQEGQPPGALFSETVPPPSNDTGGEVISPPSPEGGESPTETGDEEEQEPSPPAPPSDDMGDEEEGEGEETVQEEAVGGTEVAE